jgi:hypothetical protein
VDTRGKIPALADRLYVSPYLLRPLRRLEEVEKEAARAKSDGKRSTPSASNDDRAPGRAPAGTEK